MTTRCYVTWPLRLAPGGTRFTVTQNPRYPIDKDMAIVSKQIIFSICFPIVDRTPANAVDVQTAVSLRGIDHLVGALVPHGRVVRGDGIVVGFPIVVVDAKLHEMSVIVDPAVQGL